MLDEGLAELYEVGVKVLNQAVKRNKVVFDAIRKLMAPPKLKKKRPIGFDRRRDDD